MPKSPPKKEVTTVITCQGIQNQFYKLMGMIADAEAQVAVTEAEVLKASTQEMSLQVLTQQGQHITASIRELNGDGGEAVAELLELAEVPEISEENKGLDQAKVLYDAAVRKSTIIKQKHAHARRASLAGGVVFATIARSRFKVGTQHVPVSGMRAVGSALGMCEGTVEEPCVQERDGETPKEKETALRKVSDSSKDAFAEIAAKQF